MPIHNFYLAIPKGERPEWCKRIGTSVGHMPQMYYGLKPVRVTFAVNMDRESKGAIPMWEVRPDLDWDYIFKALKRRERLLKREHQDAVPSGS